MHTANHNFLCILNPLSKMRLHSQKIKDSISNLNERALSSEVPFELSCQVVFELFAICISLYLHNGRWQSALQLLVWAFERLVTCPSGWCATFPQRSCQWPWGTETPPPEWTEFPSASQTCRCISAGPFQSLPWPTRCLQIFWVRSFRSNDIQEKYQKNGLRGIFSTFSEIFFLLQDEHVMVEKLLKLFVTEVDAELFEAIELEYFEASNV